MHPSSYSQLGAASPHCDALTHDDLTEEERAYRARLLQAERHVNGGNGNQKQSPQQHQTPQQQYRSHDRPVAPEDERHSKRVHTEGYHNSGSNSSTNANTYPQPQQPFTLDNNHNTNSSSHSQSHSTPYQPEPINIHVPNLSAAWTIQPTPMSGGETPYDATPIAHHQQYQQKSSRGKQYIKHSSHDEEDDDHYSPRSRQHQSRCSRAYQCIVLSPIRFGWPKLILYTLLSAVFLFLAAHWIMEQQAFAGLAGKEVQHDGLANELYVSPQMQQKHSPLLELQQKVNEQQQRTSEQVVEQSQEAPLTVVTRPAPAVVAEETPQMVEEPKAAVVDLRQTEPTTPTPAAVATPLPPAEHFLNPNLNTDLNSHMDSVHSQSHAGGASPAAPIHGILPGEPGAPPEGGMEEMKKRILEERAEKEKVKEAAAEELAAKEKEEKKEHATAEKAHTSKQEKDKKSSAPAASTTTTSSKSVVSARTPEELTRLRDLSKLAAAPRVIPSETWTPVESDNDYLFGDDVVFLLPTKSNRHSQVALMLSTWGKYIKNLLVFSTAADKEFGLNTIVIESDHPQWKPIDSRYHSWRVNRIFSYLQVNPDERIPKEAKMFIWLDDVTFPVLDQLKSKLDAYRQEHNGLYPTYVGSSKISTNFYKSYWSEQQSKAYNLFKSNKLVSSSSWLFGFGRDLVDYIGEFSSSDACPVLFGDDLAVSGMITCAGGELENTSTDKKRWLYDFWKLQKKSTEDSGLLTDDSSLEKWREYDAYHGVGTKEMLEQSTQRYYEKLGGAGKGAGKEVKDE